jgi:hypothetical protein
MRILFIETAKMSRGDELLSFVPLALVAVRRACRHLQFIVNFIQQVLRSLSVSLHVPLIGLLGIKDSLPGPSTQILGCRDVRMPRAGDIPLRFLGYGHASNNEKSAE